MILHHIKRFVARIPRQVVQTGPKKKISLPKGVLVGAVAMSSYDWEKEKLSDQDLATHFKDIDFCSTLKLETLTCAVCGLRLKVDVIVPDISYCKCSVSKPGSTNHLTGSDWEPFVERKDILVWRKEHKHKKGLYHYKLYGVFDDITVWEFLAVQLDLSKFRLGWDSSTAQCKQVDREKKNIDEHTLELHTGCDINGEDTAGSSEAMVYYWEVHWPTFFSNRDYCCLRQHLTDPAGRMVISSKTTRHPTCPVSKKNWRVQDYQSVMAVRPTNHPDKPGIEFSLTAFEDPGVALPESIISFVAVRTMPEFMTNLRAACIKLRGALVSAELPKPDVLRRDALLRDQNIFDQAGRDNLDALEENISKGDAAYESAWIDKLLKDSDESSSEGGCGEDNPVVTRKISLEIEAENIRKGPAVVFPEPSKETTGDTTKETLNYNAKSETSGHSLHRIKSTDELDQLDAENNEFQRETLQLFRSEKSTPYKAQKKDREESSSSNVLMDGITLNPTTTVKDEIVPNDYTPCVVETSPITSTMRQNLHLEDSESTACVDHPMSIPSTPEQSLPAEVSTNSLNSSEHISASTGYIEYEMELLLYEEKEISVQTVLLEQKMSIIEGEGKDCEEFLHLWFDLVSRKNMAFHRRLVLEILQREQDLEKRCQMLQDELRRGGRDDVGEQLLMDELLKVVDLRDQLVNAKDREEKTLQEELMVVKDIKTRLNTKDDRKDKCLSQ